MKILGVIHLNKYLDDDYNYIVSHNPKKVLLELDPLDSISCNDKQNNTYFSSLEKNLINTRIKIDSPKSAESETPNQHQSIEVIPGDINLYKSMPFSYDCLLNAKERLANFSSLSISKMIIEYMKTVWKINSEVYSPKSFTYRNKGLIKSIEENSPDIVVVGAGHAPILKKHFKNAQLELIYHEKNLCDDFVDISLIRFYCAYKRVKPHYKSVPRFISNSQ